MAKKVTKKIKLQIEAGKATRYQVQRCYPKNGRTRGFRSYLCV